MHLRFEFDPKYLQTNFPQQELLLRLSIGAPPMLDFASLSGAKKELNKSLRSASRKNFREN